MLLSLSKLYTLSILKAESRYMKIEFKVPPFLLPYSSYSTSPAIYSFVREEWPPVSEKFVPVLLTAVTLSCLPKSTPHPHLLIEGDYVHIPKENLSFW